MKISSDLLGNVGKALDEKYNTIFITMQGACGDMATASTVREMTKTSCGAYVMK